MLTLLTESDGRITAKARGALRKSSKTGAATQQLCWSELTIFENRGRWTVNEGSVIEPFEGLKTDIAAFSLGCYFSQLAEAVSSEEEPEEQLLRLCLNSLFALSRKLYTQEHIKAAFELRLMSLAGYEPDLRACSRCGNEPESPLLLLDYGGVCCYDCKTPEMGESVRISGDSLKAMRYITGADDKRFLAFKLGETDLKILSRAAERYTLSHLGRNFSTLDYWKSVK